MFQIFSTFALSCLIVAPAPKPPVQLHLHMEKNSVGKEENLHHVNNNQPSHFLVRKADSQFDKKPSVKDTHTPAFSHIVTLGGSLPFHNETAGLHTPHTAGANLKKGKKGISRFHRILNPSAKKGKISKKKGDQGTDFRANVASSRNEHIDIKHGHHIDIRQFKHGRESRKEEIKQEKEQEKELEKELKGEKEEEGKRDQDFETRFSHCSKECGGNLVGKRRRGAVTTSLGGSRSRKLSTNHLWHRS